MRLEKIELSGFKSYDESLHELELGDITVLLGANGSGKSNLVSLFNLIAFGMSGNLQGYVLRNDVNSLLYYGSRVSQDLKFAVTFKDENATDRYAVSLSFAKPDRLYVSSETVRYEKQGEPVPFEKKLNGGFELALPDERDTTSLYLKRLLQNIHVYQFEDTSDTARIKARGYVDDASYLRSDAGNLAAFLYRLKNSEKYLKYYNRIVAYVKKAMPQFDDFSLELLDDQRLRLNWTDAENGDYLFGPHQISDGSLRFMALATLLLQPPELQSRVIVLDEPELGLHPQAIVLLASMIKTASRNAQVVVSTQSTRLVDEFSASDVAVIERDAPRKSSVIKRLDAKSLEGWLEEYSLSELWEKNVFGGQP